MLATAAVLLLTAALAQADVPGGTIAPEGGAAGTVVTLTTSCDLGVDRQVVYLQLRVPEEHTEDPADPRLVKVPLRPGARSGEWTFDIPDIPAGDYWVQLECASGLLFPMDNGRDDLAQRLIVLAEPAPGLPDAGSSVPWPLIAAGVVIVVGAIGWVAWSRRAGRGAGSDSRS